MLGYWCHVLTAVGSSGQTEIVSSYIFFIVDLSIPFQWLGCPTEPGRSVEQPGCDFPARRERFVQRRAVPNPAHNYNGTAHPERRRNVIRRPRRVLTCSFLSFFSFGSFSFDGLFIHSSLVGSRLRLHLVPAVVSRWIRRGRRAVPSIGRP